MDILFKPKMHIRWKQHSTKRSVTTIEGFDKELDLQQICKAMRKAFSCNGSVEDGGVIQLQGDHREAIRNWLVKEGIVSANEVKDRVVIHG